MRRTTFIETKDNIYKYKLINIYEGFGIYNEIAPNGIEIHQSYLLTNEDDITIMIESYNNIIEEEILDRIDNYLKRHKFGIRVIKKDNYYIMHPNGEEIK